MGENREKSSSVTFPSRLKSGHTLIDSPETHVSVNRFFITVKSADVTAPLPSTSPSSNGPKLNVTICPGAIATFRLFRASAPTGSTTTSYVPFNPVNDTEVTPLVDVVFSAWPNATEFTVEFVG